MYSPIAYLQARAEAQLASFLQQKGHLTNDVMMGGNATSQELLGLWKEADNTSVLDGPATPKNGHHVSMVRDEFPGPPIHSEEKTSGAQKSNVYLGEGK
jgi:hypothetical protein